MSESNFINYIIDLLITTKGSYAIALTLVKISVIMKYNMSFFKVYLYCWISSDLQNFFRFGLNKEYQATSIQDMSLLGYQLQSHFAYFKICKPPKISQIFPTVIKVLLDINKYICKPIHSTSQKWSNLSLKFGLKL